MTCSPCLKIYPARVQVRYCLSRLRGHGRATPPDIRFYSQGTSIRPAIAAEKRRQMRFASVDTVTLRLGSSFSTVTVFSTFSTVTVFSAFAVSTLASSLTGAAVAAVAAGSIVTVAVFSDGVDCVPFRSFSTTGGVWGTTIEGAASLETDLSSSFAVLIS